MKNLLGGQILYRSFVPPKKRRQSQVKESTIFQIQQGLVDVTKQVEEQSDMFKNNQQEVSDNMGNQENLIKALNESITAQR